ncbi:MAG: hydrogenase expression protein HypE, partial [Deltaproteobacteria bacterium]
WGPVVQCNMVSRGALGHNGGCMNTGGICIGCTMPGFPDAFAPFYKSPPGTIVSGMASRTVGSFIRPLRRLTQGKSNWTARWKENENVPSGWGHQKHGVVEKISGFFYNKLQQTGTKFSPNSKTQQKLQESGHSFLKNNSQAKQPEEVA